MELFHSITIILIVLESVIEMIPNIYCNLNILLSSRVHGPGGLISVRPTTCQIKGYVIIPLALEKILPFLQVLWQQRSTVKYSIGFPEPRSTVKQIN